MLTALHLGLLDKGEHSVVIFETYRPDGPDLRFTAYITIFL